MAQIPLLTEITTRHQVYLEGLKTQTQNQFDPFLIEIANLVKKELSNSNITEWRRDRYERLLVRLSENVSEVYQDWFEQWIGDMNDIAEYESGFEERSMIQVMDYDFDQPATGQLLAAVSSTPLNVDGPDSGKLLEPFFRTYEQKTIDRINGAIRVGYATGKTNREIQSSILNQALVSSKREANLVTRTGVQHVAMTAREQFFNSNEEVITGARWVSTLDSKTTTQCRSLDGTVFKIGKGPRPPLHIGCRSSVTPEVDGRFKYLKKGATRPSRGSDGVELVPQSKSYYAWLKQQDPEFIESVVGPTRAKLLIDGGLSADRFAELNLNKKFEPLTLKQMRQLEPLAFKRAGIE